MIVVADAQFDHYHSACGRGSAFQFGRTEVRNRRYIVKKHGLSIRASYHTAFLRFLITVSEAIKLGSRSHLARGLSNIVGFLT